MIQRYLEPYIISLAQQFPIVGIVGSRQAGKTTLAKSLAQSLNTPSLYLDLEFPEDRLKLSDPALFLARFAEQLVIIDEIQLMPEIFPILRSLIDQHRKPSRFIVLGSASPILLTKSGESLAGRIVYVELNPLTLPELNASDWENLWLKGGFPDSFLRENTFSWIWRNGFLTSYITRDLPQLGVSASPVLLDRLLRMLASIHGELLNESMLSKSLGIPLSTIGNYIDFLENSYLIRRLYSYHTNLRKRMVKTPKLYFRDSGLLHRLLGVQSIEELYGNPLAGNSFEGFVIQQIIASLNDNIQPCFYRTADGSELDLVLVKGIQPLVTIEIKLSNAPKIGKGNTVAMQDLETLHNFVITPSAGNYPLRPNLWVTDMTSIWEHLKNLDILK